MKQVILYITETCSRCHSLISWLEAQGIPFETKNLQEAVVITDLRMEGCFEMSAPILQIGSIYHPAGWLFVDGRLQEEKIREAMQ